MGENSKIEWCDHTFNPWVGCTPVSAACDFCYAESWAKRTGQANLWKGDRRRTTAANWKQPLKWNSEAAAAGLRRRVFCASLADVFDNQVPEEWRADMWALIAATPHLDWLLLTKRPQNIAKMLPGAPVAGYGNVWLGTTAEDQPQYDIRWGHLSRITARVRFISYEPALGPLIDLYAMSTLPDLVIGGGESGSGARPSHWDWFRYVRDYCAKVGVIYFHKQNGEWAPGECAGQQTRTQTAAWWDEDSGWHFEEITVRASEEMHCDDEPDVWRVGKKIAGRLLDGIEHNGMPGDRT